MNSKKLIIHIGYPKTATKTLQNNVFSYLFQQGKIEYLNHTGKILPGIGSCSCEHLVKYCMGYEWASLEIEKELCCIRDIRNEYTVLSSESLAHVSNEYPTADKRRLVVDNIERLHDVFSDLFDEVHVLASVRSQSSMLMSYYVQEYYNIIRSNSILTDARSWLENNIGSEVEEDELFLNYSRLYSTISCLFGVQNTHFVLYEDILYNSGKYFDTLSKVIPLSPDEISCLFTSKAHNVTVTGKSNEKITDPVSLQCMLSVYASRLKIPRSIRSLARSIIPEYVLNRRRDCQVAIKQFSEEDVIAVKSKFRNINIELSEQINVDTTKLVKYGYL